MDEAELHRRIHSFSRWHYEIDLRGQLTPIYDPAVAVRHRERKTYFFDPLVRLCGGSLAGKRVLDLGCNAGFWSLLAVEAGCDFVLGIDGRAAHVEQANLVFEARGVDPSRFRFRLANVFDLAVEELGSFDIVLCLGLLYHVAKPVDLLEWISRINSDLLLIDTSLSGRDGSLLEIAWDDLDEPRSACDRSLVLYPTRAAVLDMVRSFGYSSVVLRPNFASYEGSEDFRVGLRRAFVCARRTDLASLTALAD
jgi:SAM-dependent methyltransferase